MSKSLQNLLSSCINDIISYNSGPIGPTHAEIKEIKRKSINKIIEYNLYLKPFLNLDKALNNIIFDPIQKEEYNNYFIVIKTNFNSKANGYIFFTAINSGNIENMIYSSKDNKMIEASNDNNIKYLLFADNDFNMFKTNPNIHPWDIIWGYNRLTETIKSYLHKYIWSNIEEDNSFSFKTIKNRLSLKNMK